MSGLRALASTAVALLRMALVPTSLLLLLVADAAGLLEDWGPAPPASAADAA